jgi:hypothetical protein
MFQLSQSLQEIEEVCKVWQLLDAPDELILRGEIGAQNGTAMFEYIRDHCNNVYTRENLTKAFDFCAQLANWRFNMSCARPSKKPFRCARPGGKHRLQSGLPAPRKMTPNWHSMSNKHFAVTSFTALDEAAQRANVQRIDLEAEARRKEIARQKKDAEQNRIRPHSQQQSSEDLQKSQAAQQAAYKEHALQRAAQQTIESLISSYCVNSRFGAGRIDYSLSESGRNTEIFHRLAFLLGS